MAREQPDLLGKLRQIGADQQVTTLAGRLPGAGMFELFRNLEDRQDRFRYGRNGLQALLETLAWRAADLGAHHRAATLLGCAEHVRQASAVPFQEAFQRQQHDHSAALATRALGQKAFDAAYQRGLAMTIDDAIGFAVADTQEQRPPKPRTAVWPDTSSLLTRRERQIAGLIADDLNTRQIAARLFISE